MEMFDFDFNSIEEKIIWKSSMSISVDENSVDLNLDKNKNKSLKLKYYLENFYKKSLGEQVIREIEEILIKLDDLYQTDQDEIANNYLLSLILSRVGFTSNLYDFDEYSKLSIEQREIFIENNCSSDKCLFSRISDKTLFEFEMKRVECFFSSLTLILFDEILSRNKKSAWNKFLHLLTEDLRSNIVEHRFIVFLVFQSIVNFLSKLIQGKLEDKQIFSCQSLSFEEIELVKSLIVSLFNSFWIDRLSDSDEILSEFAHRKLIELVQFYPEDLIRKDLFNYLIYSIISQERKISFNYSIRCLISLLKKKDLKIKLLKNEVKHLLIRVCSIWFVPQSNSNSKLILKLIEQLNRIYPDLFNKKMFYQIFSSIFLEKNQNRLEMFISSIDFHEKLPQKRFWTNLIDLIEIIFKININQEILSNLIDLIEKDRNLSSIYLTVDSLSQIFSYLIQENVSSKLLIGLILVRTILIRQSEQMKMSNIENIHLISNISEEFLRFIDKFLEKEFEKDSIVVESLHLFEIILSILPVQSIKFNRMLILKILDQFRFISTTTKLSKTKLGQI